MKVNSSPFLLLKQAHIFSLLEEMQQQQDKSSKIVFKAYDGVGVCVCVRACERVCVHAYAPVCKWRVDWFWVREKKRCQMSY